MGFSLFKKKNAHRTEFSGEEMTPEQQQILNEEKKEMISGIEDLSQTSVKEVMVPRIDVDFISEDILEDELFAKLKESGHSRFPVYSESIDNVIGVLYVKDLLYEVKKGKPLELAKIIRKAYFVPESKSGNDTSGIKVKGVIQWVNANNAVDVEIRKYGYLLNDEEYSGQDFSERMNKNSVTVYNGKAEPYVMEQDGDKAYQLLRTGYFKRLNVNGKEIISEIVSLKDNFNK